MDGKSVDLTFGDETSFQDYEFDTYAEYNDSGDNNVTTNYVSSINVEEYAFQELDLDAKYRSIQAINSSSYSAYSTSSLNSMAPPSLSKGSSLANKSQSLNKAPLPIVVNKTNGAINVPEMPFHVAFTQFETKCDIDTVVSFIDHELKIVLEISHEFYHERCRWDCVYLCGPTRCKFEFNVFKSGNGSYIVEGNRLSGESFPFNSVFRNVKSKFTGEACSSPKSVINFQCIPLPESSFELSESEIEGAIIPVLAMANSGKCESQVNAAQIFCDLSLQKELVEVLCQKRCIDALVKLVYVDFDYCNQHALCALANLSSSRSCQELLLDNCVFLQKLLQQCCCGCHNTAEMRRECARLLANLCSAKSCAMKLFESVGQDHVCSWMDTVDDLRDERLRVHAKRAKDALRTCI